MLIYKCDNCKKQTEAMYRKGDGAAQMPSKWMKVKLSLDQNNLYTATFCSIECVKNFDEAAFISSHSLLSKR
jgi:hypothetical protein